MKLIHGINLFKNSPKTNFFLKIIFIWGSGKKTEVMTFNIYYSSNLL